MYKRVLVPLDGSSDAETVLPFILAIAGPLDFDVTLLRVLEPVPAVAVDGSPYMVLDDVETHVEDAKEYLHAIAAELRAKGVRVDVGVRQGVATEEILAAAKELGADLIAMSTHGRSGFRRFVYGSVAEAVLRRADVPVFLLRAGAPDVAQRGTIAAER
jgi:nucleotide-binding universal stress UspA family protein